MPAADDLFRPTAAPEDPAPAPESDAAPVSDGKAPGRRSSTAKPSGRVRHDEKMTVYVTSEELLAIEQARLQLRSLHGLAVDRGRLVREALGMVLADFEAHGGDSALVRRLVEE
jgi:hypothetical protein